MWKRSFTVDQLVGPLSMYEAGGAIRIRTLRAVVTADARTGAVAWRRDLPRDHPFGYKGMAVLGDVLAFTQHPEGNPREVELTAVDAPTGKIRWTMPLGWTVNENYGGVMTWADCFVVSRWEGAAVRLLLVDPEDGSIRQSIDCPPVLPAAMAGYSARTAVRLADGVYFAAALNGITRLRGGGEDGRLDTPWAGPALQVFPRGERIGAVICREDYEVAFFDEDGHIEQALPVAGEPAALHYTPGVGLLAVLENGDGLAFYPEGADQPAWSIPVDAGAMITNAVITPHGIIVAGDLGEDTFLHARAVRDGAARPTPEEWADALHGPVFFLADRLWVELSAGLTAYTFTTRKTSV